MRLLSRVVWSEGMHLAQHHFQAQSRYFEDSFQFALSQLFGAAYGVAACELDPEALRNDTVSLLHARGVMPDGLAFDIPASDAAPPPLPIRERFSPTEHSHLVLLTIPTYRPDRGNVALESDGGNNGGGLLHALQPPRYRAEAHPMIDETLGRDERAVSVGRKNFGLTLDRERPDDVVTLPIARVRRDGSGHFIYDPEYIAPSLRLDASARLMQLLARLVEILDAKSDAMSRGRRGGVGDFAGQEIASFWLLHTIHASLPVLRHYLQARHIHPERLYLELARLAGSLCTFALDVDPRTLPSYDHEHLETCFDALDRHIRAHLEVVTPSARTLVPLQASQPYLFTGTIPDGRLYGGGARWFLAVRGRQREDDIATRVPQLVKVCSSKFTMELVRRGFPGLSLQHIAAPPPSLGPRADTQYFAIERAGPCWETLSASHEIGVYVPDAFVDPEVELVILGE